MTTRQRIIPRPLSGQSGFAIMEAIFACIIIAIIIGGGIYLMQRKQHEPAGSASNSQTL